MDVADPQRVQVHVHEVTKTYRGVHALAGASMTFGAGITCILGRNGAGKSTLVRQVVGIERPTSGHVAVSHADKRLEGPERAAAIGWLPQSFGFPSSMTALQFVSYAGWLKGLPRAVAHGRAPAALEATGLGASQRTRLSELSGGMLRRAGLAAATVHEPTVLVLDEPTAGLDPMQRADFHRLVLEVSERSAVLLATHLLEDVEAIAETIHILDRGAFVWDGTPLELSGVGGSDRVSVDALRAGLMAVVGPGE